MRYRAIAVTQDQDFLSALQTRLGESADLEIAAVAGNTRDAVQALTRAVSQVAFVDSTLSSPSAFEVIRELQGKVPHVAVLLVTENSSVEVLGAALNSGARNVLNLNATLEELRDSTLDAAGWAARIQGIGTGEGPQLTGSSIITLAGGRGGAGTTTTAIHLARSMVAAGRRVCLVDLDLAKGSVATLLNISGMRDITALADLGDVPSAQTISDLLYQDAYGLRVLCAPTEPERAEKITDELIRDVLIGLRQLYEVIIVDGGSGSTASLGSAIEVSDSVCIVTTPDMSAILGAKRLIDLTQRLKLTELGTIRVLLNRVSPQAHLQPKAAARMLDVPLMRTALDDGGRILERSINERDPGAVTDKKYLKGVGRLAAEMAPDATAAKRDDQYASPERPPKVVADRGRRRRTREDAGVVTAEFMALVPILFLVMAAGVQGVGYAAARFQAGTGADAAAHACSRGGDPARAARTEIGDNFTISVGGCQDNGAMVSSRVTVTVPRFVPKWIMAEPTVSRTGSSVSES